LRVPRETNVEREIKRLYGLPPDRFTAARDTLAKKLHGEGEKALSARVKELRKPTVAAAVVNRLAREERMNVRALLTAGERLQAAQIKLLRGGSPDAVHKAAADERKAIGALLDAARREGASESVLRRVEETLRAAAVDDDARDLVKEGRVTHELQPVGFGFTPEQLRRSKRSNR
jgi:hypothetical protein